MSVEEVIKEVQAAQATKELIAATRNATSDAVNDLTDLIEKAADSFFTRLLDRDAAARQGNEVLGVRPEPADGHRVLVVKLAMGDLTVKDEDFIIGFIPVWGWVTKRDRSTDRVFAVAMVLDTDYNSDGPVEITEYIEGIQAEQPAHYQILAPTELELDTEELSILKSDLADERYRRNRKRDAAAALRQRRAS